MADHFLHNARQRLIQAHRNRARASWRPEAKAGQYPIIPSSAGRWAGNRRLAQQPLKCRTTEAATSSHEQVLKAGYDIAAGTCIDVFQLAFSIMALIERKQRWTIQAQQRTP
jgi:hypothetical protein